MKKLETFKGNIRISEVLDAVFLSFITDYNARVLAPQSLVTQEILQAFGYFQSFPHYLNAVSLLDRNSFAELAARPAATPECCIQTGAFLLPAACLNVYPLFENQHKLMCETVTTRPRVFRNEGERLDGRTRLWEFEVREMVYLGSREFVQSALSDVCTKALDFARLISPDARVEYATDHFYDTRLNALKRQIQKDGCYKRELLIPIDGEDVAVASFNFHETHFSRPMKFDRDGENVTGCSGFGIERWVAAVEDFGKADWIRSLKDASLINDQKSENTMPPKPNRGRSRSQGEQI